MGCYFIGHLSVNVLYNCIENTLSLNHKCFTYRDMVCAPFKPIYIYFPFAQEQEDVYLALK